MKNENRMMNNHENEKERMTMKNTINNLILTGKRTLNRIATEERGDTTFIAIALAIIGVIAIGVIFKTQITNIVNGMFANIKSSLGL